MNFLWFLLRGQPPPNVDPWLPVAPDYQQVNVVVEREEATSMLTLTRALLIMLPRYLLPTRSAPDLVHAYESG